MIKQTDRHTDTHTHTNTHKTDRGPHTRTHKNRQTHTHNRHYSYAYTYIEDRQTYRKTTTEREKDERTVGLNDHLPSLWLVAYQWTVSGGTWLPFASERCRHKNCADVTRIGIYIAPVLDAQTPSPLTTAQQRCIHSINREGRQGGSRVINLEPWRHLASCANGCQGNRWLDYANKCMANWWMGAWVDGWINP